MFDTKELALSNVKELETLADKARKEEVDLCNECDQIIFACDKSIEDLGSEVTADTSWYEDNLDADVFELNSAEEFAGFVELINELGVTTVDENGEDLEDALYTK